ncbi:hypothetical protein CBR_g64680 [Chara braunii]|uniref:Uncharacterized protein n=1 Tax=Chara braunii TaxID=69332 RepID=A0A388MFR9_CHABU|nr:hypothetical protein CBR_g64680 [Chara braunii]|eukprot:GBG93322.1 hypothetical protein CBR_g64680 [Chara braunii]
MRGFDWEGMVDECMTAGVVVLVTKVGVVVDASGGVDDVLVERAVDMGYGVIGVDVEAEDGGREVAPEMVETNVLMSSMDDWRDVIMPKRATRSMATLGAGVCSLARLRGMLSTESERMSDISMLDDWAMVGEEAVVDADEVAAAAAAALAAAASAAAR